MLINSNKMLALADDSIIRHASDLTSVDVESYQFTCLNCGTEVFPESQNLIADIQQYVYLHPKGTECIPNEPRTICLFLRQSLVEDGKLQTPDFKITLEAVKQMVPGYENQFYELPAEIFSVHATRKDITAVSDIICTNEFNSSLIVQDSKDKFGVFINYSEEFMDTFSLDPSGRIPVFAIDLHDVEYSQALLSKKSLVEYIQFAATRRWLTHSGITEMLMNRRTERYSECAKIANHQSAVRNSLVESGIFIVKNRLALNEDGFSKEYHQLLCGLSNYSGIMIDPALLKSQQIKIAQSKLVDSREIEKIVKKMPEGVPLPYSNRHILSLYLALNISSTLSHTDPYGDCFVVANWLVEELNIPYPLSQFIQKDLFYCLDVNQWRSCDGLTSGYESKKRLLCAKRLLLLIWELVHINRAATPKSSTLN